MGRVIAVTNSKGGIGKTTTVVNIGAGMALMGARVLVVDVDAQGNAAIALGITPSHTIYEVLVDGVHPAKCVVQARPNLDLIASDDTLLGAQPVISRRNDWARVLDQALQPLKNKYDFIFIDSPGSLSVLSVNALMASNELLVPTTVEHLSIRGLAMLFKQVARITTGSTIVRMIIPTMVDPRLSQSRALLKQLQQTYGSLVSDPVRVNVRLSEASLYGKTIYEHDAKSRGALDYAQLVQNLSKSWEFQARKNKSKPTASQPAKAAKAGTEKAETKKVDNTHSVSLAADQSPPHAPTAATNGATPQANGNKEASARASDSVKAKEGGTNGHRDASTFEEEHISRITFENGNNNVVSQPNDHESRVKEARQTPPATRISNLPATCPQCGHSLRRTTIAGYRLAYCDNCKFHQQELVGFKG